MRMIRVKLSEDCHARPAIKLSQICSKFKSELKIITYDGRLADSKNIMEVLNLHLKKGQEVVLVCNGIDELEALEAIRGAIE